MKNGTITGALEYWRREAKHEAENRRRHACPYCRKVAAFADLIEFVDEANYWLECRNCGVEWNVGEEVDEVLKRLGLAGRQP